MLQGQYSNDFAFLSKSRMSEIKGRTNYTCVMSPKIQDTGSDVWTCAEGPGASHKDSCPSCPYIRARSEAVNAQIALMNTAYYMAAKNGRHFGSRKILIIDEAHSLADYVLQNCEIKITNWSLKKLFSILDSEVPKYNTLKEYGKWLDEIEAACANNISIIGKEIRGYEPEELVQMPLFKQKMRELEAYKNLQEKINRYRRNKDIRWVWEMVEDKDNPLKTYFILKPLDISRFAEDHIFSGLDKVILMSATLLNKNEICDELGINGSDAVWIESDSPFPSENHRFMTAYAGSLNFKEIDKTLPKVSKLIQQIISFHPNDKGIVHCNSFKILDYLQRTIKDKRLLFQEQGSTSMKILEQHRESKKPTILVSPSMTEGVDLRDDLSRWQIIVKLPFGFLGDKYIKTKADLQPNWYLYKMALTFVQAMGRSIRNEEDWAITYCLDPSFEYFIGVKAMQEDMIPEHIKDIIYRRKKG
jgi:ATP-dependent DNA helicase DinG